MILPIILTGFAWCASAQPMANLQGYWKFEEGRGTTAADSSGNGFTGTLLGATLPTWISPGADGMGALQFGYNKNDRVDVGNPPAFQITGAMTVSAWALANTTTGGRIITKGGGSGLRGWELAVENGGFYNFMVPVNSTTLIQCGTDAGSVPLGAWVYVTGVYDPDDTNGPSLKVYTNGVLVATVTNGVPAVMYNAPNDVCIGARADGSTRWDGDIDEVRLFDRALTQSEIQALPELNPSPLSFTLQPVSRSIVQNRPVTFETAFAGTGPYAVQWYENDNPIYGATNTSYTIDSVAAYMDGYTYKVSVSNSVYGIVSTNATLTISSDNIPPTLVSVGSVDGTTIGLAFSEPMDQNTFYYPTYFKVNGSSTNISYCQPRPDGTSAELFLLTPISGSFTVEVTNVTDLAGNPIAPGASASGTVAGLSPADYGNPLPPQIGETFSDATGAFDITAGGSDIWGTSDSGHFASRQVSGDFDVSVNVNSVTAVDPSSKAGVMVRQSLDDNSATVHVLGQASKPAGNGNVVAGVRPSAGAGTSYMGIVAGAPMPDVWVRLRRWGDRFTAFQSTNGVDWVVLGEANLTLVDPVYLGLTACAHTLNYATLAKLRNFGDVVFSNATLTITQPPADLTAVQNTTVAFEVQAQGTGAPASEMAYQWQRSDGLGGFTNLPNATGPTYSFLARAADSGAQFRAEVYFAGQVETSAAATLTLTPDVTPPTVVSVVSSGNPTSITVIFSEDMDPTSASDASHYQLSGGGTPPTIIAAQLSADGHTVFLTTSDPLAESTAYTLAIQDVTDLAVPPNPVAPGTEVALQYSSLVGYWKLDEGSGTTTADYSGNQFTGTLQNSPTWVPGKVGPYALQFNGANQRVFVGNPPGLQITGPLTLAAWVWVNDIGSSGRVVAKQDGGGHRGWTLNVESVNLWAFAISPDGNTVVAVSSTGVQTGSWIHFAGVYDPNDPNGPIMKLYTNGVMIASITNGVPASQYENGQNVCIGSRPDNSNWFNGKIDDVRIYTSALTDAEVAALAAEPPVFQPPVLENGNLILNWTGQGQLQSAPAVTGVYTNILPTPVPPYTNAVVPGENRFFRLLAPLP